MSVAVWNGYAECHYAECRYAKCRFAECDGAVEKPSKEAWSIKNEIDKKPFSFFYEYGWSAF
jgi:hypothetical protein